MSDDKSNQNNTSKNNNRLRIHGSCIEVSVNSEFMEKYFGPRCRHYDSQCDVCSNYRRFEKYGWVYVNIDHDKLLDLLIKGELK